MDKRIWEGAEVEEEDISYLKEMITSQPSIYGALGALAAGAILSIPLGLGVAAIPLLGFAAAEAIAALFIPSSPVFQERVNKKKRAERRDNARAYLTSEIERRNEGAHWPTYHQMCERVASIREIATNRQTSLSERDVERLDDATVDFLSLWLAWLVMAERWKNVDDRDLERRIEAIDDQIESLESPVEKRRLSKAKSDLERILKRREGLWARATSVEAAMLSRADAVEEIYQRVMTDPTSNDLSRELSQAVEKMEVEEELDVAVEAELSELFTARKRAVGRRQAT